VTQRCLIAASEDRSHPAALAGDLRPTDREHRTEDWVEAPTSAPVGDRSA
jgi:hypothetical protein